MIGRLGCELNVCTGRFKVHACCLSHLQCIGSNMSVLSESSDSSSDPAAEETKPAGTDESTEAKEQVTSAAEQLLETAKTATIPDRVKVALGDASDFGRFREGRVFTFLHLFSGPNDRLAAALKEEGAKAGLKVSVDSVDIKMDKSMDLRKGPAVEEIEKRITQGNYDGFHAGFPCGSFSRVRWVESAGMPGPVRSRQFPYGLPSNSPKQQEEADDGTLMATRSLGLMQKQIWSQRSRRVPQAATVENPPGDETGPAGSAWMLQEVEEALESTGAGMADFNTCTYMDGKERFFKPGRWAGRLENLESLAKVCRCPPWVKHVPVTGKGTTVRAGVYPDKLCSEVAKLCGFMEEDTGLGVLALEAGAEIRGGVRAEDGVAQERREAHLREAKNHGHEKSGPCGRSLLGASKADSHRDHGPGEGVRP